MYIMCSLFQSFAYSYTTSANLKYNKHFLTTRYVDGMPTSEITPVTIQYIHPPHHGHTKVNAWTTHIPFVPCQSALPLLRCGYFKLWPWNIKVKVMGVVKRHDHVVSPVSNWFTSFLLHINQTNNSWNKAISKFDLEISKVKVKGEVKGQSHTA